MKIIHRAVFKTKMAIKSLGLFIDGMNQNGPGADFICSASASL